MFIQFNAANQLQSFKRANLAGLTFHRAADGELDQTGVEALQSGFELRGVRLEGAYATTAQVVQLRKSAAIVAVNPEALALLGQSLAPTTLIVGDYGQLPLGTCEPDDLAALEALDWVVRIHLVQVGGVG